MKTIDKTKSLCDVCLKKIPAETFLENGKVCLRKVCPRHGEFVAPHAWDDPEIYHGLSKIKTLKTNAQLSLPVTNRCNLNCAVCYAKANEIKIREISLTDLIKVKGYQTIILSGGEPTIREDLPLIIQRLKQQGSRVMMLSNGLKLSNLAYVQKLKKAGLECVMLQFDALSDQDYRRFRGKELNQIKKQVIANLEYCDIAIHLLAVMLKGKHLIQIKKLLNYSARHPGIKSVNFHELWKLGRFDEKDYLSSSQILAGVIKMTRTKKRDWLESTELLCGVDKFVALFSPKRRLFAKCNLKCLVIRYRGEIIPVTRIFDTRKINAKLNKLTEHPSQTGLITFLFYFFFNQVILNFILNGNFRLFFWRLLKNSSYWLKGNFFLFDPFQHLTIAIFHTLSDIDFSFVESCNYKAFTYDTPDFDASCIHRIKVLRRDEEKMAK